MRKGEILNLKWDDVNVLKGSITVRETKNYECRDIPLNDELKKMFLGMEHICGYVFTYEGRRIIEFKRAFNSALKRSQIPYCRFHDLSTHLLLI